MKEMAYGITRSRHGCRQRKLRWRRQFWRNGLGGFSSYGPSADGRVKPDVSSVGVAAVVQNPITLLAPANGTSFATPNMAGLGTRLWQGFPEFNNMRIVRALKEAGANYNSPNDRVGAGVPI